MSFELSLIFGLLWLAWGTQALLSMLMVRKLLHRRILQGSAPWHETYKPFAHIVVPVKGIDDDLPANIQGLCKQDYPAYRIVFVVESHDDPAYEAIQTELANLDESVKIDTQVVVAGLSDGSQGQKVHNQLKALELLDADSSDDDVWVFADSDAVPGPDWLRYLVGPLAAEDRIGATTGYRWLVPDDPQNATLWTHVASVINSSVASFCGRRAFNRAWGGSMAVRASVARKGEFRSMLTGALTDDYQLTRMVQSLGLYVQFVPECVVPSPGSFTFASLANFVRRQYLITRVYFISDYLVSMLLNGLYCIASVSAATVVVVSVLRGWWPVLSIAVAAMVFVFITNQLRATYRRRIMEKVLGASAMGAMRTTLRLDRWWTWAWMSLHFMFSVSVMFSRRMVWRGVHYRIRGRQDVKVLKVEGHS